MHDSSFSKAELQRRALEARLCSSAYMNTVCQGLCLGFLFGGHVSGHHVFTVGEAPVDPDLHVGDEH